MSVCFSGSLPVYSCIQLVIIFICFVLCWRIKYDDDVQPLHLPLCRLSCGAVMGTPLVMLNSVFTALHVMQTRYCDENSVRPSVHPSVCHTRVL